MADEMTVNQRPSATPYLLGGAALGAGGGYALSKWANLGIKTKYKSWEDAVAETNKDDAFIKKQIDKGGDNAENWKTIKAQADKVKEAEKALEDAAGSAKDTEELKNYMEKLNEVETKEAETLEKLLSDNEALVESFKRTVEYKNIPEGAEIKNTAEFKEWALKQNSVVDITKRNEDYKKIRTEAKLGDLEKAVKDRDKDFNLDKFKSAREELANANKDAEKTLTEDLLKKCKKPNNKLTAAIGAAVLALGALALRPKANDAV